MRCSRRWRLASRVSKTMVVNVAENRNEEATRVGNYWISASEAIDYGVANKIISSIKDLK
jgi:ATP-dependent protease ClpP protease subunit